MTINLPIGRLYTYDNLTMPIEVVNGRKGGPRLFVSAAIHGDELNGVEIIRRLLRHSALQRLRGTLIAVPVVNVHGLLHRSRYLPDRRDLNRSFPGSSRGSLAGRIADLFMREIVANCTHGIDLHTGAVHRENLPHIRANLDDPATLELARAFGVPVLLNSDLRDGSLREAAMEAGIPMLLYEGGEALRFHEISIRAGLRGVLHVMRVLGMLPASRRHAHVVKPVVARSSSWVRAPESGVLRLQATLGTRVRKGDVMGVIAAPLIDRDCRVEAPFSGILIAHTHLPLVHEGEALFHLARFGSNAAVAGQVEALQEMLVPTLPEDEVI
ncbi:MAG TPA: succinylglutamate desuccinylase/aspartoacylase family protein [Gammaproteobacteria bacterium]|nr:succinylglutamate desuccinylase/aspartoacylase family protein [Gammaproteobacteria bacterium]